MKSILSVDLDWARDTRQAISLISLLMEKFKNCEKIIFIKEHHQILKYIEIEDNTIYNIDHHHDFGYDDFISTASFREGNWLHFLINNNMLKNYFWIHNVGSPLKKNNLDIVRTLETYVHTIDLNICNEINFSKVVICESFEYENFNSPFLYNILLEICKSNYKDKTIIDYTKNIVSYINIKQNNFK